MTIRILAALLVLLSGQAQAASMVTLTWSFNPETVTLIASSPDGEVWDVVRAYGPGQRKAIFLVDGPMCYRIIKPEFKTEVVCIDGSGDTSLDFTEGDPV